LRSEDDRGGGMGLKGNGIVGVGKSDPDAYFSANLAPAESLTDLPILAGQTVEFQVEAMNQTYGHFTGVDLSIDLNPTGTAIPEPLSAGLAGLGMLAVGLTAMRRRSGCAH
jgi:hypothetical protein